MSKGVDMGRSENGGQRCDVGDLQGHRHRCHDEPKCGVCEMSQMILLSSFDSSESLSFLQSEYSLFRSQLICVHFHSAGICVCVCVCARVCVLVAQSCPTFCDPMDWSPLGSSVRGILQARTLEWVTILCSNNSQKRHYAHLLSPSCSNLGKGRGVGEEVDQREGTYANFANNY